MDKLKKVAINAIRTEEGRMQLNNLQIIKGVEFYVAENSLIYLNLENVARGLGFTQIKGTTEYVRWETIRGYLLDFDFSQDVGKDTFIPEPIFYLLAMKADSQSAREFQKKVAYEVLPSIRKNGGYISNQENLTPEQIVANALIVAQNIIADKDRLIAAQKPMVEFFEAVADSKSAVAIGDVAKVLGIKGIGRNNLFELLREKKVLMPDNKPYQKYIDSGYFRVIEQKFTKPDSVVVITFKTLVYQKGIDYIRKLVA